MSLPLNKITLFKDNDTFYVISYQWQCTSCASAPVSAPCEWMARKDLAQRGLLLDAQTTITPISYRLEPIDAQKAEALRREKVGAIARLKEMLFNAPKEGIISSQQDIFNILTALHQAGILTQPSSGAVPLPEQSKSPSRSL